MKNNFSTILSPPKNQDMRIEEFFFVDSIYAKTIDVIKSFFSIFKHGLPVDA